MLVAEFISFSIAFWLGLYLVRRYWQNPAEKALIWAAGGLISYSIALALSSIGRYAPPPLGDLLQMQVVLLIAPLIFWAGALWHLRDLIRSVRERFKNGENSANVIGLVLVATLFFSLGFGLILAPFELIPPQWLFIAIAGDLLILGVAVGLLDAFDQGEALRPDFVRSVLEAEVIGSIFSLQVGLVMILVTGVTLPLVILLYGVETTALLLTVFGRQWQDGFDQLAFPESPGLVNERKQLREITEAIPKSIPPEPNAVWPQLNGIQPLSDDNIIKQTRVALSHLGNMPKLATNPLVHSPIIEKRLEEKGSEPNTLVKATELKQLLIESIEQLKPEATDNFQSTKAWRHYNALYFPYVRGLRPYGRRANISHLSDLERDALEWFDREVPHRTLYNWQSAAAKIIANDLIEQNEKAIVELVK